MKKLYLLTLFVMAVGFSFGQDLSVDEFLDFAAAPSKKFDSYIVKKGFIPAGRFLQNDTAVDTWEQAVKLVLDSTRSPVQRKVSRQQTGPDIFYSFQTSSKEEYLSAISKLKTEGFKCAINALRCDTSLLFQKKDMTVQGRYFAEDTMAFYSLFFHRKKMPSARSIIYGNDLLQFTSHEYLTGFFGSANVRKDLYYFSDKEINKCSVLFPNTPRQAVFIWDDEMNMTGLSQIIIGGSIRTEGSSTFNRSISENTWSLDNGIHYNMRLEELVKLNGQDLSFFGRSSDYYLMIKPQSEGDIDLSGTGIVFDCINCGGAPVLDTKLVSSSAAMDQGLRLHVGMIMLFPSRATVRLKRYASR